MSTAAEIARDVLRATNKNIWCAAHCKTFVDENWDTKVKHDPACPWLVK